MIRSTALLFVCALAVGCGVDALPSITNIQGAMPPPPRPGVASMFQGLMVPVPGGRVNASGGNLFVSRRDMSLGTRVAEWSVGSVWNSATGRWHWNFDLTLVEPRPGQPPIFTDATGYSTFLKGVAPGERIPGTKWFAHAATAVRSAGGLIHHFDAQGWLEKVHWASRAYPAIVFVRGDVAGASKVTRIEQCTSENTCSALYTMGFDAQGRIASIEDHSGRVSFYSYEGTSERVAAARDPYDVQKAWPGMRYEYDAEGRLVAMTNSHDERIEVDYCDRSVSVCSVVQRGEGDPTWSFAYTGMLADRLHASTAITDPLGHTANFVFDFGLRTKRYTNPDGETWTWSWSDTELTGITSPAGVSTGYALSSDQSVLTVTEASGNRVVTTYAPYPAENRNDPFERPILDVVDDLGPVESRTYAPTGELTSISNGEGEATLYTLAANGDLSIVGPNGIATNYTNRGAHGEYVTLNRGGKTVTRSYDVLGNLLSVDGLIEEDLSLHGLSLGQGGVVSRTFDPDGNVSTVLLEDSTGGTRSTLHMDWRADHQLAAIVRPYGGDTHRVYDELGRVEEVRSRVDGMWHSTYIEHDPVGRRTATVRPNGMATRWTYLASGRLESIRHERDSSDPLEFDGFAVFEYVNGQQTAVRDAAHEMTPEQTLHDSAGRVQEISFPGGEKLSYEYDLRNRVVSETFIRPDSAALRVFEYAYDLAGRTTSVKEDGVEIQATSYANGRVDSVSFGNGINIVHGYDLFTGAFAGFTATDSAEQLVAQMTVDRTTCGIQLPMTRCVIEHTQTFSGVATISHAEYQLDDIGTERLVADSTGATSPIDSFYSYDELSNLTSSPGGNFVYNAERNRLLAIEGGGATVVDYTYDDAGFVTSREGVTITWNGMGRVTAVGADLTIEWDAQGRMTSKSESGDVSYWRYGGALMEDDSGSDRRIDLDWVVLNLDLASREYRLFDFRGGVKLTLDDGGVVTSHHHYGGYDRILTDGATEDATGFAGGVHMGSLVLLDARIYDPLSGRFMSEDPIPQALNQYSYTLGNPIRFWDPNGLEGAPTVNVDGTAGHISVSRVPASGTILAWQAAFGRFLASLGFDIEVRVDGTTTVVIEDLSGSAEISFEVRCAGVPVDSAGLSSSEMSGSSGQVLDQGATHSMSWMSREARGWSGKRTPTYSADSLCGLGFEVSLVVAGLLLARRGRGPGGRSRSARH